LLAGLCTRVVLLTDGDERGQAAVPKLEGVLKAAGFDTLALALPPGEDPDSLFRSLTGPGLVTLIRSLLLPPEGKAGSCEEISESLEGVVLPVAAEIALPTAAEQEGEVVSDIDRLVATLPFVSRPGERMAVLIRINCLKEKLDTVSTALGRPPAVF
ncbi:MAG: toprim domain-containing protein, partial [Lentisphaeria bacterium]